MDDDYDYQQTRRDHNRRVWFTIIAVIAGVGLLVMRFALRRDRSTYSTPTPVYTPSTPTPAALPIARDPVEFEIGAGATRQDVIPGKIVDIGGTLVTFEPNPTWLAAGNGFHFKHRNTVSVSPTPDTMIASVDGVVAKLQTLDPKLTDAEARRLLSSTLTDTGQTVGEATPVSRVIAGKPRDGVAHDTTTTMKVEVFLVQVGKTKLGVLLYRQDPNADPTNITALLASVAEGPGEPLPEFTAKVDATSTPVFIDKPATVGKLTFTLRRRPTILRTMIGNGGSLTFEHPRGVAVSRMPNDQMLVVAVQSDKAAIQLFDLQMRFTVDELKTALMGQINASDLGEATHTLNGETIRGRKLRIANMPVDHELFVFERGGKTIGASIQYVPTDEQAAIATALPILLSVH